MTAEMQLYYDAFLGEHVSDLNARGIIEEYLADERPDLALAMLAIAIEAASLAADQQAPSPTPAPVQSPA